tara:strand:- start:280 stop:1125 length:846 start_codon:yes stop_codon:yes gene_type:complete
MGFFSKKDKNNQKEEKNEVAKAEYRVVIVEKLGGTVREIKELDASRFRDDEDHVVYLKNDKQKFLEIFPQQINDFKNYTEAEVDKLITKYQDLLERERDSDTDINDKDIEVELLKLKAKKRSFNFSQNASYLSFSKNGRPTFYFLREGSTFHPVKWDVDTKTIFTPSDNRKKSASLALRNKQNKYNTQSLLNGASIILIIVAFLMAAAGGYFMFKSQQAYDDAFASYDESEIAQATRACLESASKLNQEIVTTAETVSGIAESVEEDLNKPQTVIQGVIPE